MTDPQFYGKALVTVEAEDDGSRAAIYVEVKDEGAYGCAPKTAHCALDCEQAAALAERLDAAIDLMARTARARAEAKTARIAGLKELLSELESSK